MRAKTVITGAVCVLFLAASFGCRTGTEGSSRGAARPSVVVIVIDTLRADHLGTYGYHRNTTPYLDRLASQSIVFENVVSAASATFPSVNSLFTSRSADAFFRSSSRDLGIPEPLTTMAEVFRAHGYRTIAISASPIVRATPSEINPGGGFGQGFQTFDEECSDPRDNIPSFVAPCVSERTIEAIDALPENAPFFIYIHFLDPHDPYRAPADPGGFVKPYAGKKFIAEGRTWPLNKWITKKEGKDPGVTPRDIQHLIDLYDAEIRAADAEVGRVMKHFREAGRYENTLFVIMSDHGESFLENGALQHSYSLYQTELHVPLLFHWPAHWRDGRRDPRVICSLDIFPTLLAIAGISPPPGIEGIAALTARGKSAGGERACLSEARSWWDMGVRRLSSVRRGNWKLIRDRLKRRYQLYDLARDPQEQRNLWPGRSPEEQVIVKELETMLNRPVGAPTDKSPKSGEKLDMDPNAKRALRSLGYIE